MKGRFALAFVLAWSAASGDVLRVCPQCELRRVADAVAHAVPGDTIVVESGMYPNSHIVIDKPLTILGEGRPVLDGGGTGTVIEIRGAGVHVQNIVVANTGYSALEDRAGIKLIESIGSNY